MDESGFQFAKQQNLRTVEHLSFSQESGVRLAVVIQIRESTITRLGVTGASQRHRDSGHIPLLFFRLGTGAVLWLRAGRNGGRRLNCFVLCNDTGGRLLHHVDDRILDQHLRHLSWRFSWCLPCHDLRWPLFLGRGFRCTPDCTPDLGLCLFRCRPFCGLLARRLGTGLATFRAFLARRNALLCFGHDCPL
jgi:hypothetical protein